MTRGRTRKALPGEDTFAGRMVAYAREHDGFLNRSFFLAEQAQDKYGLQHFRSQIIYWSRIWMTVSRGVWLLKEPDPSAIVPIVPPAGSLEKKLRQDGYVRASEFALRWNITASTIRRWVAAGHIPAYITPTRMFIPLEDAERAIRENGRVSFRKQA